MKPDLTRYIEENYQAAIDQGHIRPYYQPVIRTISEKLCSFEALARWIDPVHGVIGPEQFIPVLEKNRVIHLLDACVIRQVCARIRRSMEDGETPIPVSVNLSRLDFELCDIFSVVDGIATQYQIPHDFLYIEITESVMAENEGSMRAIVDRFHTAGYQVWMDDFGSGYSSLNVLKDFEFNELKLDMKFLSSFDLRSRRILTSIIQMAKAIDIHTLAEGVETREQVSFLRNIGCEKAQGFFYGSPMPYAEALARLRQAGIEIEMPQERKYYDDIGRVNLLSAVPFMTRAEQDALKTARQLNSIPLAIAEGRKDSFSILFYNTAFEQTAESTGLVSHIFTQELLRAPQPYSLLPARLLNLMDYTRTSGEEGRMYFISNDDYYEIQAKCIARTRDAYSVLFRLSNLSKASRSDRTDQLDEHMRQLFTLFERITLLDLEADAITPLYVATREDLVSGRTGIRRLAKEYAEKLIFPEDRQAFLALVDFSVIERKLYEAGRTYISRYFRSSVRHGQYAWRKFIVMRLRERLYALLVRDVNDDLLAFEKDRHLYQEGGTGGAALTPEVLWKNLIRSDIARVFWKDEDRRFLGASKGFLDYYGFASAAEIIGRNDEDLGWHVHPDLYMNDELQVIHEGVTTHNVPGRCINFGENREILASKTPLYDENGQVRGLMGVFVDREMLTVNDRRGAELQRRDFLTGLLSSRGIAEEAITFQDEYDLRHIDFVRMHVGLDDLDSLNRQYGFDFGDRVITAMGTALKDAFGRTCAVGRTTGHRFAILHQIRSEQEALDLRARVRQIAKGIRHIDGTPITLYISVGFSIYSDTENLDAQTQRAEINLLADQGDHTTQERRSARASEIFRMYDDLPIPCFVCRVLTDAAGEVTDALMFYANRAFEQEGGKKSAGILGRRMSEIYPNLAPEWHRWARRAALEKESITDKLYDIPTGRWYYVTVSPVIHAGYCCFTYQSMDALKAIREKDA